MNFFNTKADKDLNKKYMRDYKNAVDFNRYMYMYHLFIENQKLHAKLNQQTNQTTPQQPRLFIQPPLFMQPQLQPPFINPALNMYQPYLFNYNSQISTAIKTIHNITDIVDPTIHDIICLVQNSDNDIIIVREVSTGKWMLPAGNINNGETPLIATRRIFTENTSFILNDTLIKFPIKYYDIKHSNNTITRLFKINTSETFGNYTPTASTDRLEYISIPHIKLCLIQFIYFNIQNIHTFTKLFHIGLI